MGYLAEQLTREGYDRLYAGAYRHLAHVKNNCPGEYTPKPPKPQCRLTTAFVGAIGSGLRSNPTSILDAGGSAGYVSKSLAAATGCTSVIVLDPAAHELPTDVTTIRGYLEDADLPAVDLALCLETADHLTNPLAALATLRRAAHRLFIDYIDCETFRQDHPTVNPLKIDHPLYWTKSAMARALELTGWQRKSYRRMELTYAGARRRYRVLLGAI